MTTPCSRPADVSSTRGSPLAYLTISIRSLLQAPLPVAAACQPSEELRGLLTKTMSPSTTHIKRQPFDTQHSATNASSCNLDIRSRTAPRMVNAASVAAPPMSPSSASPHIHDATKTSARYPAG